MSDAPDPVVERNSSETVASFEHHSRGLLDRVQHFLHRFPTMVPVIVLVLSLIAFGLISPNFFSAFNLSLIMQQVAVVGTLAAAQSLVILTAGIDLSVGAVMVMIGSIVLVVMVMVVMVQVVMVGGDCNGGAGGGGDGAGGDGAGGDGVGGDGGW